MKRSLLAAKSSSAVLSGFWLIASSPLTTVHGFMSDPLASLSHQSTQSTKTTGPLFIQVPPGSGYFAPEDEVSALPDTYEPMMEYPGTMRPGRTPENIPFQDLPIADTDPDPVPWPHFQQIEWHHRWGAPHDHATPMELFIEQNGRWASPELEAAMRAGIRRGVRERREAEEAERRGTIITDDDEDDDDEMSVNEDPVSLGDGVFGQLGSDADRAQTAAAVDPKNNQKESYFEEEETEDEAEGALDDFLFDLGLDSELGDDDFGDDTSEESDEGKPQAKSLRELETDDDEEDDVPDEGVKAIQVDDDDDLDFDDDDEETDGDGSSVNLDDFDGGDEGVLDGEDIFDEGGFDFDDDYGGSDGGDMW